MAKQGMYKCRQEGGIGGKRKKKILLSYLKGHVKIHTITVGKEPNNHSEHYAVLTSVPSFLTTVRLVICSGDQLDTNALCFRAHTICKIKPMKPVRKNTALRNQWLHD